MGRIRLLPDEVASQVAAGEVVERPASVLKELVENSLDAGATRIDVEYHRGGDKFLAVTDDGRGMDREDALLCLERHATSKIRTGRDLATVGTFGFRGEAVPSIASVSQFRLVTREATAEAGTEVLINGGKIETVRDSGEAPGTRIEVRSLFFNLPARRKFLRGERTEASHIDHHFQVLALAHPALRFSLTRDGRLAHQLAAAADLQTRARELLGAEFAGQLFPLEPTTHNGLTLRGLLARPGHSRGDRSGQYVFVNGRAVHSSAIWQPLREAYGSALPRGVHPPAVLFVELDPEWVDCNVHPAKREVRFRDAIAVREAVRFVVEKALAGQRQAVALPVRVFSEPVDVAPVRSEPPAASVAAPVALPREAVAFLQSAPMREPAPELPLPEVERAAPERFRFIGALADRYVLMEDEAGLVLLDHRAARERILFEQLLRRVDRRETVSQRLLLPTIVELAPRDLAWTRDHAALLAAAGLLVEAFGSDTVKVDGLPPVLAACDPREIVLRVADDCRAGGVKGGVRAIEEAIARSVCRSAPAGPAPDDAAAARALVDELMACDLPYACPNGRPTMIHFAHSELARKFGRG
ncbi:MAG TPA: DNA mismatch repair endonuclease MutL [Chthoniobacterales bacterium]